MPALFLGSIGVLAETSHLQRNAFNEAFREAGLDWHWSESAYRAMLSNAGGKARIERHARARGEDVDAEALHARKSVLFQEAVAKGVPLRAGVRDALQSARAAGWRSALVTTTAPQNVTAILRATGLQASDFDAVLDKTACGAVKPDPACYFVALDRLGVPAGDALAVEDNPDGVKAAMAAGLSTVAFPGAYHTDADFHGVAKVVDDLNLQNALAA